MKDIIEIITDKDPLARKLVEARNKREGLYLSSDEVYLITSSFLLGLSYENILEELIFSEKYKFK